MNKKGLVIDGNAIMFRAFHATYKQLDYFKKNNLTPNNALKTMSQMLFNIMENNQYTHLAIAFDAPGGSFRNELSEDYKSNRKSTPEELIVQIPAIHEMTRLMGFNVFCIQGIEADDVVGSISKLLSKQEIPCDVFSSDRDMFQLIDNFVSVKVPQNGGGIADYNLENFQEKYFGLNPKQVIDFKAIAGDKSDNVIGVKGIGEKGASDLIKQFGSLEKIYEEIDAIKSQTSKQKLIDGKESAFHSKKIVTILTNYFDEKKHDDFLKKAIDLDNLRIFLESKGIRSLERYLI